MKKLLTNYNHEQFLSLMTEEEVIFFLMIHQKRKIQLCETDLKDLRGTHIRQTYALYTDVWIGSELRNFSVDISYWWDFETSEFAHRVESAIEYPDKAHQLLQLHCETLCYADSESY